MPYNGTYQTASGSQQVSETAVRNGKFAGATSEGAHWPLNASSGRIAFDVEGGHHGWIQGANWVNTSSGTALAFDGNDSVRVPSGETLAVEGDFAVSVTFKTNESTDYVNDVRFPRLVGTAPQYRFANTSGFQIAMREGHILGSLGNGSDAVVIQEKGWMTGSGTRPGSSAKEILSTSIGTELW